MGLHAVTTRSEIGTGSYFSIALPVSLVEPTQVVDVDEGSVSLYGVLAMA
jgi:hypothetical protein